MLRLLQSFFGCGHRKDHYPKAVIREAIEKVVERTDPWLKIVSGYKRKLRPAVIQSLDHITRLVNSLPPPIPAEFGPNGSCPALAVFFNSTAEMVKTFHNDRKICDFLRDHNPTTQEITVLLMMEKFEKIIFGAELSGNVVVRDVPQVTVTFMNQRFLEPADNERETRHKLESRAFDHLLRITHRRVAAAKSARKDLERQRTLLQSKLALRQRGNWDPQGPESSTTSSVAKTEEMLRQVEAKLLEQGSDDKVLDAYLDIAINILSHPEEHLWETKQKMILDQRGIKRAKATENAREFTLQELYNSEGEQWVMLLVALPVDDMQSICAITH